MRCAIALLSLSLAVTASAQELPRMELGVGAALLTRPYYGGSAQYRTTALPVPYAVYRGERVQVSREGLIARLFNTENVRVGLSLSASLPGRDGEDSRRRGMPGLLPTFEAGPSLDWRLSDAGGDIWQLRLPLRAVAAANFREFHGIGWLAYPNLHFQRSRVLGDWSVVTATAIGPLWGSREYHRYFYAVEPQYETPERPAYDVGSGYSGARAKAYLGLRTSTWHVGLGITYDSLAGAVMEDSPLVESRHAVIFAMGVFYTLWASERPASDEAAP